MRHPRRGVRCEEFRLDRDRFAQHLRREFGELVGLEGGFESGGTASAIESRVSDARDAGAILGPPGVEVVVYGLDDSMIAAVREIELPPIPTPLRQLATCSFEVKYLVAHDEEAFDGLCATVEKLLGRASALLPSFHALLAGERSLRRSQVPRRLAAFGAWRHCPPRH